MGNCTETAALLKGWDKVLVVSHASPDGDTLGSACALMRGLISLGKQVDFYCADEVPAKYGYLFSGIELGGFTPEHIVSVDVADLSLLGKDRERFTDKIELAIDHHGTHVPLSPHRWVEPDSAATTEMIFLLLQEMGVNITRDMADDIYTGLSTDTGCFRYRNVTPRTHRIAAQVLELGANAAEINRIMFECKSPAQVEAERRILDSMTFFCDGKCAMVQVPWALLAETGVTESDLEGVAAMPRQIDGVVIGITLKEKSDGGVKASVRSNPPADSSALCGRFGGGGHEGAAGCSLPHCTLEEAAAKMTVACEEYLKELEV